MKMFGFFFFFRKEWFTECLNGEVLMGVTIAIIRGEMNELQGEISFDEDNIDVDGTIFSHFMVDHAFVVRTELDFFCAFIFPRKIDLKGIGLRKEKIKHLRYVRHRQ